MRAFRPARRRLLPALAALAMATGAAGAIASAQGLRGGGDAAPARANGAAADPQPPPTSIYAAPSAPLPALRGRGAPPAPAAPAPPVALLTAADLPALARLRGGGDAAPMCRAQCAGDLYVCAAGGDSAGCQGAYATCRAACGDSPPPPGRLVSPLPDAGLAPAGPLRSLPGALGAAPPLQ